MNVKSDSSDSYKIDDDKLDYAVRWRIQAMALFHRVGKGVDVVSGSQFKLAGTLGSPTVSGVPEDVADIIENPKHEKRVGEEEGFLVFVRDNENSKTISVIDLTEQILDQNSRIRTLAVKALARQKEAMLPQSALLIEKLRFEISSNDEKTWLPAALRLHRALNSDILLNIIALTKSQGFHFDDYEKYYQRVFRPNIESLNNFAPPLLRDRTAGKLFEKTLRKMSSNGFSSAISEFVLSFGYFPPTETVSVLDFVKQCEETKGSDRIQADVWNVAKNNENILEKYHGVFAICGNPSWITDKNSKDLEKLLLDQLTCARVMPSSDGDAQWHFMYRLVQHYMAHLEVTLPAVDTSVVMDYAWWLAHNVLYGFFVVDGEITDVAEEITNSELDNSVQKWSVSRSTVSPSVARSDALFTSAIWSDSLMAIVLKNWEQIFPVLSDGFCKTFVGIVGKAIFASRLNVAPKGTDDFFVSNISFDTIEAIAKANEGEEADGLAGVVEATKIINQVDGINQLLRDFVTNENAMTTFAGIAIQARQYTGSDAGDSPVDFLTNRAWRKAAFQDASFSSVTLISTFLSEWQLGRSDCWRVRLAHVFAVEAELSNNEERRAFLFEVCLRASINVDIASPVQRLLVSEHRDEFLPRAKKWKDVLGYVAYNSTPWAAYRIRGFLAKIEPHLC